MSTFACDTLLGAKYAYTVWSAWMYIFLRIALQSCTFRSGWNDCDNFSNVLDETIFRLPPMVQ